jgi:ribosomal-protein-alanine N-acetyltransferase
MGRWIVGADEAVRARLGVAAIPSYPEQMALLDWMAEPVGPVIEGEGVVLRPPRSTDYADWSELRALSREHLQPWEPTWPQDDLTRAAFRRRLNLYAREMELGGAWPFFILDHSNQLVGGITLSNVRRGIAETATVGYWIGLPAVGRGHATAAVRAIIRYAFGPLRLHRLEAACLPTNAASRRVLEKSGFQKEGEARAYLKINGAWADHLLFGVIADAVDADDRPSS